RARCMGRVGSDPCTMSPAAGAAGTLSEAVRYLQAENMTMGFVAAAQTTVLRKVAVIGVVYMRFFQIHIAVTDINGSIFRRLVLRTHGEPIAVIVRQRSRAVFGRAYRRLVPGNTGLQLPLRRHLIHGAYCNTPGVLESQIQAGVGQRIALDSQLGQAAPAGPLYIAQQFPAWTDALIQAEQGRIGQRDAGAG